jgi:hypothetical protein
MGTEKFWQEEKKRVEINKDLVHPDIQQTFDDAKALFPNKNFRAMYYDCLEGAMYIKQWAQSDDLSLGDMATLICRDIGCELTMCQASIADPYERPFNNCDEQFRKLNKCITQEEERYQKDNEGRTMQEQVQYILEKKKKEKYFRLLEGKQQQQQPVKEREYILKEDPTRTLVTNNKL